MKCTHCATNIVADARFCPQCGQPTQGEECACAAAAMFGVLQKASSANRQTRGRGKRAAGQRGERCQRQSDDVAISSAPGDAASLAPPGKKLSGSAVHALLAQANLNRMRRQYDEAD